MFNPADHTKRRPAAMTRSAIALFTLVLTASIASTVDTVVAAPRPAQDGRAVATPSILDGVYTTAQARRGQQQFEQHCASCHRADLGGLRAPALKGDRFVDQWREFPLAVLFNAMQQAMPLGNPGALPSAGYLDISAYVLEVNGYPAGGSELTEEGAAKALFVSREGPKPLPTSSPAIVAGCMTKELGVGWFLTNASEAARTLNPYEFVDGELASARQLPSGGQVFRLQNLEDLPGSTGAADRLVGRKVVAKGILVRHEKGTRLNVAALDNGGEACEQ